MKQFFNILDKIGTIF